MNNFYIKTKFKKDLLKTTILLICDKIAIFFKKVFYWHFVAINAPTYLYTHF